MDLSRRGREYVKWPYTADGAVVSADVLLGGVWHSATVTPTSDTVGVVTLLCAGPSAADNPEGTVVLTMGRHLPEIRFNDNPELIVRGGGEIVVY